MKKNIDPAFKAAQEQNKLIAWAYPSKVKKTLNQDREMAANNLRRRNAEDAAVQARQAAIRAAARERAAEREAARKKPLKEYYKKRLTEDSLNETSARRKLATMAITGSLSALGGSVLGAAAPHIRSATIGNPVAQARQNTANSFGLFGSETHPARRAMAGAGVGLGVAQVGDMVGGIASAIRRRRRKLEEATPAEIQAHQIQRLDKLGDKVGQKNLSNPANLRAATRIAMLYNKAGVAGGKYPYSGIAGSPGMISMPTRPAHPKAIAAAETGLKGLRGSNRTVGQRLRGAIRRTIGLEENKH